jgi:hypothetical protein
MLDKVVRLSLFLEALSGLQWKSRYEAVLVRIDKETIKIPLTPQVNGRSSRSSAVGHTE